MADRYHFVATGLTGGTASQDLDAFSYSIINDGDIAYVVYNNRFYVFEYDSSSSASENVSTHPYVVKPDDNTGNGRWLEKTCNVLNSDIDHDQLTNFVANEHIDWTNTSSNFKTTGVVQSDHIIITDGITAPSSATGFSKIYVDSTYDELFLLKGNGDKFLIPRGEYVSRTINLDSSMSASDIQDEIDAVGKYIPAGVTITFQFADGTYTLSSTLSFKGFYGGGTILIQGNTSETDATTLHTSQQVYLDFSGGACNGIELSLNYCAVKVRNLKINVADSSYYRAVVASSCYWVDVWYNYLLSGGTTNAQLLVYAQNSTGYAKYNYFTQGKIAIYASNNAHLMSAFNDDTGTQPAYGLWADTNSVIGKNSTQPAGSTANENTGTGGVIR